MQAAANGTHHSESTRRQFLRRTGAMGTILTATSLAGCDEDDKPDRALEFKSLSEAAIELERLAAAKILNSDTAWNWPQTLDHCSQSIEYSMTGFPQMNSALFQRTAGTIAFGVFAWRGRMSHNLAEPIPQAPPLAANGNPDVAVARLRAAISAFSATKAPLRPHFAYGKLSKAEFDHAHAMHLANHFSFFFTA